MKKKISALALVLVLLLSVTAFARWEGEDLCRPSLNFSGTTAVCTVRVSSDNSSAKINATVKFMRGGSTLATWPLTGTGSVASKAAYEETIKNLTELLG